MHSVEAMLKAAVLALIGLCAAVAALWLEGHRSAVPHWGYVTAALLSCFFVTLTWALFLLLGARDRRNATLPPPQSTSPVKHPPSFAAPMIELTIYILQPGHCYEVKQTFQDYYGNTFTAGERLTFQQRHFLPYDGGHTVMFVEKTLYLQEEVNRAILDGFSDYLVAYVAE